MPPECCPARSAHSTDTPADDAPGLELRQSGVGTCGKVVLQDAAESHRLKRLVLSPKRDVVDPALAGAAPGLDTDLVLCNGGLLGRLLDTFVVAQVRAELAMAATRPRL